MKLPIIGITSRVISNDNYNISKVPENLIEYIKNNNAIPLVIPVLDDSYLQDIIKIFDGFIIPGGNTFSKTDEFIINYAIEKDIPLIGICAGMQAIGNIRNFNTNISDRDIKIKNDTHANGNHEIIINDGLLKDILNKKSIIVNSRHHDQILNDCIFKIDAVSKDKVIEAIHIPNKKLILGLQWHPEDLQNADSQAIFKYFIKKCKEKEK